MRCSMLLLLMLAVVAGCTPPVKPPATVTTAEGKPPKTPQEWAEVVADAKAKESAATEARETAEAGLRHAKIAAVQTKLYVISGISLLAALGCVALAIFLPGLRKQAVLGFLAAIAVAGAAWGLSALIPYLLWVGLGLLALLAAAGLIYWKRESKALEGVVAGVEKLKAKVPDYKATMHETIDAKSDRLITAVRKRLGLLA